MDQLIAEGSPDPEASFGGGGMGQTFAPLDPGSNAAVDDPRGYGPSYDTPSRGWGDTNAPSVDFSAPSPTWGMPEAPAFENPWSAPAGEPIPSAGEGWGPVHDWGATNADMGSPTPTAGTWGSPTPPEMTWGDTNRAPGEGASVGGFWGDAYQPPAWGTPEATPIPDLPWGLGRFADVAESASTPNPVGTARAQWERANSTAVAADKTATAAVDRTAMREAILTAQAQQTAAAHAAAEEKAARGTATREAVNATATAGKEATAAAKAEMDAVRTATREAQQTAAAEQTAQPTRTPQPTATISFEQQLEDARRKKAIQDIITPPTATPNATETAAPRQTATAERKATGTAQALATAGPGMTATAESRQAMEDAARATPTPASLPSQVQSALLAAFGMGAPTQTPRPNLNADVLTRFPDTPTPTATGGAGAGYPGVGLAGPPPTGTPLPAATPTPTSTPAPPDAGTLPDFGGVVAGDAIARGRAEADALQPGAPEVLPPAATEPYHLNPLGSSTQVSYDPTLYNRMTLPPPRAAAPPAAPAPAAVAASPGTPATLPPSAVAAPAAAPAAPAEGVGAVAEAAQAATGGAAVRAGSPITIAPGVEQHRPLYEKYFGDLGPEAVEHIMALNTLESAGDAHAHNTKGEDSRGLGQINVGPGANTDFKSRDLFNPAENIRTQREIFNRQGWGAWSTERIYQSAGRNASMPGAGGTPTTTARPATAPAPAGTQPPGTPNVLPDLESAVTQRGTLGEDMPGARTPAAVKPGTRGAAGPPPVKTGNAVIDDAAWVTWMRANDPTWVPPGSGHEDEAKKAAAGPHKGDLPTNKPSGAADPGHPLPTTPIATSPSGTYRLSDGNTKTIVEMRKELADLGWAGDLANEQAVLAAYQRTTGKTLSPTKAELTPEARKAQVARWTPNIVKAAAGTNVPADVALAAVDFVSQGDPAHPTGLMGVPAAKLPAGAVAADGDTQLAGGLALLKDAYAATGDWGQAFSAFLSTIGVTPSPAMLAAFQARRLEYGAPTGPPV